MVSGSEIRGYGVLFAERTNELVICSLFNPVPFEFKTPLKILILQKLKRYGGRRSESEREIRANCMY